MFKCCTDRPSLGGLDAGGLLSSISTEAGSLDTSFRGPPRAFFLVDGDDSDASSAGLPLLLFLPAVSLILFTLVGSGSTSSSPSSWALRLRVVAGLAGSEVASQLVDHRLNKKYEPDRPAYLDHHRSEHDVYNEPSTVYNYRTQESS